MVAIYAYIDFLCISNLAFTVIYDHYFILGYKSSFALPARCYTTSLASENIDILDAVEDQHGGVIVNMEKPMESMLFSSLLQASISHWRQQV